MDEPLPPYPYSSSDASYLADDKQGTDKSIAGWSLARSGHSTLDHARDSVASLLAARATQRAERGGTSGVKISVVARNADGATDERALLLAAAAKAADAQRLTTHVFAFIAGTHVVLASNAPVLLERCSALARVKFAARLMRDAGGRREWVGELVGEDPHDVEALWHILRRGTRSAGSQTAPPGSRGIDEVLAAARAKLTRATPGQAFDEVTSHTKSGSVAVLVDIRPAAQRAEHGEIPGALIIERNVLEWRFDPRCDARLPIAAYDLRVIVFCQEGYTSSLAAAALQELGVMDATDINGGFSAWKAAGLVATEPKVPVAQLGAP